MKIVFSILFAIIILLSGTQFTMSTHYCGGELAASKLSISGDLASCGMEKTATNECVKSESFLHNHCCSDAISVYEFDNNYLSTYTEFKPFEQSVLQVITLPENLSIYSLTSFFQIDEKIHPPGSILPSAVSLPKICVFRI